jgi:hypothetical protein
MSRASNVAVHEVRELQPGVLLRLCQTPRKCMVAIYPHSYSPKADIESGTNIPDLAQ